LPHQHERKEKICLNCGSRLQGRFCHNCGQENLEPKESIGHLLTHFFNDVTQFDGKFFTTLKDLLIKPGFLSREYMSGRRVDYLNPVKMYLFTSAIFFLLFFPFLHNEKNSIIEMNINGKSLNTIDRMDSATFAEFTAALNEGDDKPAVPMTRKEFKLYRDSIAIIASPLFSQHTTTEAGKSMIRYWRKAC
jgi:ribosomal protein L40E